MSRELWVKADADIKVLKDYMRPLLSGWLVAGIQGKCSPPDRGLQVRGDTVLISAAEGDSELAQLRQMYLPETILAYVSTWHFAGTSLARHYLLECMELASVVADKNSDIAACFVEARRMKELVEAFALCSKALAVCAADKKPAGASSKKIREAGWSRDLWSVRSEEARR